MIDILFINPTSPKSDEKVYQHLYTQKITSIETPTMACLMASYARNKGFGVMIIDMQNSKWSEENIIDYIKNEKPKLIVVVTYGSQPSGSTQNIPASREISKIIKNNNPKTNVMWTGTHVAALPQRTLSEEPCDYVCYTEGFQATIELAQALKENELEPKLENVHGIMYYKDFFGSKILQTNDRGENLSGFEFDNFVIEPAFDLLDDFSTLYRCSDFHALANLDDRKYASIFTSFNCLFKCSYCCIAAPFGKPGYVKFSPINAVNQIEKLVRDYGIKNIKIVDEMHVLDPKHVIGICNEINKRGLSDEINFWAYSRSDVTETLDKKNKELLEIMSKNGYRWLAIGYESASELNRVDTDKKYTRKEIENVTKIIQSHGINIIGNIMAGLPNETHETMNETLEMAMSLKLDWINIYSRMLYPGSQDHKHAMENNEQLAENIEDIGWIGYSQHAYETFPVSTETLTNVEILKFRDEAFKTYFKNNDYQQMIKNKFGNKAYEYVKSIGDRPKLKRKILGD